mgnify:CR=1 FL=1
MSLEVILTLAGDNISKPIKQACEILLNDSMKVEGKFQRLLAMCNGERIPTASEISKIILATTQTIPERSVEWLAKITIPFKSSGSLRWEEKKPKPDFELGAMLGLFMSLNWLGAQAFSGDIAPKLFESFEKQVRISLPLMVCHDHGTRMEYTPAYEKELSDEIKKYPIRGNPGFSDRVTSSLRLMEDLLRYCQKNEADPTKLGLLVFDQLSYALFGLMEPGGRAQIMSYVRPRKLVDIKRKFDPEEVESATAT